ncbi:hypothetical protein [Qipengyuania nanhaisediminis]|uniref:hypothetical protein n=1 Tax=Qipengyuania nanhaisediminis TaxID=604088 RepID=UPI0038B3C56B
MTDANTENTTTSSDDRRDELRAKIEASERRIAERSFADQAREAAETAIDYTRRHPLQVVAGAVVAGLLIGLMTAPGRRVANRAVHSTAHAVSDASAATARAAKNVSHESMRAGSAASDAIAAFGMKLIDTMLDAGRAGQDGIEDLADNAAAKARKLRRDAGYAAGNAGDKSREIAHRTRRRTSRAVRDLTNKVS